MLSLLDRTAAYYERFLWESREAAKAREYLASRGLGEEALREFRVGYAPSAWDKMMVASRGRGYSNRELYDAGLVQRSRQNGMLYDRFRARIMFPLADVRGRVLGFGARAVSEGQQPKYLNTSDNDVYHKGRHLYGAHLARAHATRAGEVILCEGYTDVIALHQAGMLGAVGLMGTALTAEQVGELARMAQTVLLALDADAAGQEAMLRAQDLAARKRLELRVVPLARGSDPAELIQRDGPEAMRAAVADSVPFVRFQVERVLASGDRGTAEGKDRIVANLRPIFAALDQGSTKMDLTRLVADQLDLKDSVVERTLVVASEPRRQAGAPARPNGSHDPAFARREEPERAFLALCIAAPEEGERALAELDVEDTFASELLRRAARRLRAGGLTEPMREPPGAPPLDDDEELKALLAELIVAAGRERALPEMLEVQRLQLELARLDRQIQRARGDAEGDVSGLATQRGEVKREFDAVYARVLEETGAREG